MGDSEIEVDEDGGREYMKKNIWIGKLNIKIEIKRKRKYKHSLEYINRKLTKWSLMYGIGISQVKWDIKHWWEFWK